MTLSSHLFLGLPFGLLVKGFHLSIFLVIIIIIISCSGIRHMRSMPLYQELSSP